MMLVSLISVCTIAAFEGVFLYVETSGPRISIIFPAAATMPMMAAAISNAVADTRVRDKGSRRTERLYRGCDVCSGWDTRTARLEDSWCVIGKSNPRLVKSERREERLG